jgi:DNA-binding transcriptional LysR family regulator
MSEPFRWHAWQSFFAVMRAGVLAIAARRLVVTHSTPSRRIASLEPSQQTQHSTAAR